MHTSNALCFVLFSLATACAVSHPDDPRPDAAAADTRAPCPLSLVDEGDACVGWRAIPPPPCTPMGLLRLADRIGARCAEGYDVALTTPGDVWEYTTDDAVPIPPASADSAPLPVVVVLPDGTRIATSDDPYAIPEAERTRADGVWHPTLPPPSAFVELGAALSEEEALFVGRDAFVYTRLRR